MEELKGDGPAILLRAEAMGAEELARLILALQALYSRRLDAAAPKAPPTIYYERRYTRCGKPNCQPCRDGEGHGPYWYAKWREGGRLRSKYRGKGRPPGVTADPGQGTSTGSRSGRPRVSCRGIGRQVKARCDRTRPGGQRKSTLQKCRVPPVALLPGLRGV